MLDLTATPDAASRTQSHRYVSGPALRLLGAAGISFYGDWLTTVALVVLLYRLTGSPTGPALYILARVAPRVVGPLPGGALGDRFGPARIAASCAIAQGFLAAAIVMLAEAHIVWGIYVVVAASQLLASVAQPGYTALIPRLASPENLGRVQGLFSALLSSSILLSPALGALVLPYVAPELLIGIDAASFVVAGSLLTTLLYVDRLGVGQARPRGIAAGLPVVRRDPMLRFLATAYVANAGAITALQAVLVVAAAQHFGRDTTVGWLYAAVGAGSLLGTLPVIRRTPARVGLTPIIGFSALELAPLAVFVFVTNLVVAMALLFVSSIGATLYQTRGAIGLQQRVPTDVLARTTAVIRLGQYSGMLLGAIAATVLVQLVGWEAMLLSVCAVGGTLLFVSAVSDVPRAG